MSTVTEIEKAIEKLGGDEFAELSSWWEDFLARKRSGSREDKLEAIRRTLGMHGRGERRELRKGHRRSWARDGRNA